MGLSVRLSECPSTRTPTIVYFVVGVRPSVGMSVYQNAHHCVLCGWCPPVYQNFHHCVLCGWCPPICRNVCVPERLPLCTLWIVSARLSECVYQNVHHCVHCGWCLLECLSTRTSTIVYFVGGVRPSVGMSAYQNVHHCVLFELSSSYSVFACLNFAYVLRMSWCACGLGIFHLFTSRTYQFLESQMQ